MTTTAHIFIALSLLCGGAWAQGSPPAPAPDCMTHLLNASDCLTYVSSGSNLTKPDRGCCPELAGLVESNPACLCSLLGGDISFALQVDIHRALNLTSVCSVSAHPLSFCSEIGVPVGAPRSMEEMGPTGAPSSNQHSTTPGAGSQSGSTAIRAPYIAASALCQLLILTILIAFFSPITF